jgi:hypothetical protein
LFLYKDITGFSTHDSLKYLLPILDSVLVSDQKYRYGMNQGSKKKQREMMEKMKNNSEEINSIQKKNLEIVTGIIDKHGWLGVKDIGIKANMALFAVIQHADLETQEKYLPMIKEAVLKKRTPPSQYALLYDRIEIKNKRPQMYGSQLNFLKKGNYEVLPLLNPDSVDRWRMSLGMMDSLKTYLKGFQVKWDVKKYKKELPQLYKKYGITMP